MRTQLQLELLRKLRQRKGQAKGITLIEPMIVVAILGLLVGVALPRYLGTLTAGDAAAKIGEAIKIVRDRMPNLVIDGESYRPRLKPALKGGQKAAV
jgi:prepilin-type N-terminal cleavage/methylation domain-containing protein